MKTIVYTCPYVPAEWIAAHGLHPYRIIPAPVNSATSTIQREGICPYLRCFIDEVLINAQAGAVIITTVCDQMRRGFDILADRFDRPAFLMNVPNTWQTLTAQKMYLDEFKRFGRFLIRLGGKTPDNETLIETMLKYDTARQSILRERPFLTGRQFAEAIAALGHDGPDGNPQLCKTTTKLTGGVPLAVIGGPMTRRDFDLFDTIENFGGRITLDATETGERGLCAPFDRRRLREDPFMELAGSYFNGIHDASRRPNSDLYKWLKTELADRDVRGIIFRRYVWCDMWHAELHRLKDWAGLPVLDIDTAGDNDMERQRITNRIRAFLEMLT